MPNNVSPIDLTLVIPSLLGPFPNIDLEQYEGVQWQRLPALETLLSRADRRHGYGDTIEEVLRGLFELDDGPLPVAALSYLADSEAEAADREIADYWWMRVDPVHLQAGQAQLILFGEWMLQVSRQEADHLMQAFNEMYREEGWRFYAPVPHRWYLRLDRQRQPQLSTTPLLSVTGRDINRFLPAGTDGLRWHGILTEMQMLLHGHAVNRARMEQDRAMINSVWCWGEGCLPASVGTGWNDVWSAEPLSTGLARLAGVAHHAPVADAGQWLQQCTGSRPLVVLDALLQHWMEGDVVGWVAAVQALERQWFVPLKQALAAGKLSSLTLVPCNGAGYTVTGSGLRRFWRRKQPLHRYLTQ